MLQFSRRIGIFSRPRAHKRQPNVRLLLERLEGREVPAVIPLPPTGVTAVGTSASSIQLSWHKSADATVTGYDVYEKVWVHMGHYDGHYVYNSVGANLATHSETISGLASGSLHTYVVTAVNATGESLYSLTATGETWVAPTFANGPTIFLLSSGAVWSGPVTATATESTQITLLISGTPLNFSVLSGPSTVSINSAGTVTYTPALSEVGTVNITFGVSNSLGSISQTVQFDVAAPNLSLPVPTIKLDASSLVYSGQYQSVGATAYGTDGVTPVAGSMTTAVNGGLSGSLNVGTYQILATFTSADPNYNNATLVSTFAITPATPTFSYLSSPAIAVGAPTANVSGFLSSGAVAPLGDYVIITVNGSSIATPVGTAGFAAAFPSSTLAVANYHVKYAYAGDQNFTAAPNGGSTLKVVALQAPIITRNPVAHEIVSAGDGASFTAAAKGSPVITVQWQVSTDGGQTFTNITGNTSAQTTTLSFITSAGNNGSEYRAVFTNSAGTTTTTAGILTVEGGTSPRMAPQPSAFEWDALYDDYLGSNHHSRWW
jgi:hypothetical protein